MTIVSKYSTLLFPARRTSCAFSCVAMTVPPSSNAFDVDGKQVRLGAHRADPPTLGRRWMVSFDHPFLSDELVLERERPGRGARGHAKLREDVLHVSRNGVLADHEVRGDLAVALPSCQQPQHLELASGQPVPLTRIVLCTERLQPGQGRRRAELLEDAAG